MHQLQGFANKRTQGGAWKRPLVGSVVTSTDAAAASSSLESDARGYVYSSCVSLVDGVRGVGSALYSWATVKLYYAVFYGVRSLLAAAGHGVFYEGSRPRTLQAVAGERIAKADGPTHKVVLDLFEKQLKTNVLLSQTVGLEKPLSWLIERREFANYGQATFGEPTIPSHFARLVETGLRRSLEAYVGPDSLMYAFDPDHAMLAYPIAVLLEIAKQARSKPCLRLGPECASFLLATSKDGSGPLTSLHRVFSSLERA